MLFPALPPRFDAAIRDARSSSPKARAIAAERLARASAEERDAAIEAVRPLADDAIAPVRFAALCALGELKDTASLDVVLARFDDGDPFVREAAVIAAGRIGDKRALPAVRDALTCENAEMRYEAIAALAELAPIEAARSILARLADEDPEVRVQAAAWLGEVGDEDAPDALAARLDDPSADVRREVALALARFGDERAAPVLRASLRSRDSLSAATELGELRDEASREPLALLARSWVAPLAARAAAAGALVRLEDPRGVPALRSVLTAMRSVARSYAVELVGALRVFELAKELSSFVGPDGHVPSRLGLDRDVLHEALAALAVESAEAREALRRLDSAFGATLATAED